MIEFEARGRETERRVHIGTQARRPTENEEIGQTKFQFGCVDGDGETPDPIPNSAVKSVSGDGTALLSVGE